MFWLQVSLFRSGDRLLSVTIVVISKSSKSLKSLKDEMFWLQLSIFLSGDRLLSVTTVVISKSSDYWVDKLTGTSATDNIRLGLRNDFEADVLTVS
jgi:hypothetical protein